MTSFVDPGPPNNFINSCAFLLVARIHYRFSSYISATHPVPPVVSRDTFITAGEYMFLSVSRYLLTSLSILLKSNTCSSLR